MSKFYDFEAEDVMCNMHKMEEYQEQGFEILIDREGNVVERFEPTADMDVVEEKIREIL